MVPERAGPWLTKWAARVNVLVPNTLFFPKKIRHTSQRRYKLVAEVRLDIDGDILQALRDDAAENFRSLPAQVRFVLKEWHQRWVDPPSQDSSLPAKVLTQSGIRR